MGEILRFPQKSGKPGRPKEVQIHGATSSAGHTEVKIVGASVPSEIVEILDRDSKVAQPDAEIRVHEEVVYEDDGRIRQSDKKHPEIEIKVRAPVTQDFDKVKRLEDDIA